MPSISFGQTIPSLKRSDGTLAVVLSPTRELCTQVVGVATKLVAKCAKIVPGQLVGGENKAHQKARIRKGITLLVATPGKCGHTAGMRGARLCVIDLGFLVSGLLPGRLLDHLQTTQSLRLPPTGLRWLVLDEADRLLDLGFEEALHSILDQVKSRGGFKRGILVSATIHSAIERLAAVSLEDPWMVSAEEEATAVVESAAVSHKVGGIAVSDSWACLSSLGGKKKERERGG